MKKIKAILSISGLLLILCTFLLLNSPFDKIRNYNEDLGISPFTYLTLYKNILPKRKFDKLIDSLITGNMDIKSINITAEFCKKRKLYKYIPVIEKKCDLFSTFPGDSNWVVEITGNYRRESGISQLDFPNSFCKNLDELKQLQLSDSLQQNLK